MKARSLVAMACIAALGGCASWAPPLPPEAKPSPQDAYLYGRFTIATGKSLLALDGYGSIGYTFKCQDGSSYTVRFRIDGVVQLLRVKPSTCSLEQTIFTNADGQIVGRKPHTSDSMKGLQLQAGTAYYLGDYMGSIHVSGGAVHWSVDSARDAYSSSSGELKYRYPAFADVPMLDMTSGRAY